MEGNTRFYHIRSHQIDFSVFFLGIIVYIPTLLVNHMQITLYCKLCKLLFNQIACSDDQSKLFEVGIMFYCCVTMVVYTVGSIDPF